MKGIKTFQRQWDLLTLRPIRWLVSSPAIPLALQIVTLLAAGALVAVGLGVGLGVPPQWLATLRRTNLATLVVWGLWWPGVLALTLVAGRLWCTICPLELLQRLGDAAARRVGWPRAALGPFQRQGWLALALYGALLALVFGIATHRVPHFTALVLLSLAGLAFITGLAIREPRSFCRSLCPLTLLLRVYGRFAPWQLDRHDPAVCKTCASRDCVAEENRYRFDGRSCPSRLIPYQRAPTDDCVLCLQCVKACPHENLGFGQPSAKSRLRARALFSTAEAAFVILAFGFVAREILGDVPAVRAALGTLIARLHRLVPTLDRGWIEALLYLVIAPGALFVGVVAAARLVSPGQRLRTLLLAAAASAAPVVALAHVGKGLAKAMASVGFIPLAVIDPRGLRTCQRIVDKALSAPRPLPGLASLRWAVVAVGLLVLVRTLRAVRAAPAELRAAGFAGLVVTGVIYLPLLLAWALSPL